MAKKNLVKVNRHCMTDGTHEYYRNARGEWAPGYYDGKTFWWTRTRKYSARHRAYQMADGTTCTYRLTRYTCGKGSKPAFAPVGKSGRTYSRARLETVKDVYYRHGLFYVACNVEVAEGKYINSVRPFFGRLYDAYPAQSERAGVPAVEIWVSNGEPMEIVMDGETYPIARGEWDSMYAPVLQIQDVDASKDAPADPAQATDEPATESAPDDFEAARDTWIDSTTCAGDQLDLIAFFGYGDATWQGIAAGG